MSLYWTSLCAIRLVRIDDNIVATIINLQPTRNNNIKPQYTVIKV